MNTLPFSFGALIGVRIGVISRAALLAGAAIVATASYAQAPGASDKGKPAIPLSAPPSFGAKPQQGAPAPAADNKPAAPAAAAPQAKPAAQSANSQPATSTASPVANKPAIPAVAPVAAAAGAATTLATGKMLVTAGGVKYQDSTVGTGAVARTGQTVTVHYTGWLLDNGKLGRKFDSSVDRGDPFKFPLGGGRVIKGWDEGVAGMKVGGTRVLTIPPEMGYGARGAGGVIPPGATLVFEVKLLGV